MIQSRLLRHAALLLIFAQGSNFAFSAAAKPADPAVMKAEVQARGVGRGVRVSMSDQSDAKGVIVSIGEQSFMVKAKGSAQPREIEYAKVTGVHNNKMGTGTKVIIVVAIVGGAVGITAAVLTHEVHDSLKSPTF